MSNHQLQIHHLPQDVDERALESSTVIVVDLLRASSTICHALAAAAREVVPFLEIADAVAVAEEAGRSQIVLGGERKGGRIPGFDLGNSPCEYTRDTVAGRRVFFTTTNGTRALHHARLARRILVGAFVNLSAVAQSVREEARLDILCAGTGDSETREDILAAGAITSRLVEHWGDSCELNPAAIAARNEWEAVVAKAKSTDTPLSEFAAIELQNTQGGRNLLGIGLNRDLVDCAQIDRLSIVPEFDPRQLRITAPPSPNPTS